MGNSDYTVDDAKTLWQEDLTDATAPDYTIKAAVVVSSPEPNPVTSKDAGWSSFPHETMPPAPREADIGEIPDPDEELRLIRKLGEGGMGVVYSAHQVPLGRQVAVKMMKPQYSSDQTLNSRFCSEAVLTGLLDHPNVVPVHKLGNYVHRDIKPMNILLGKGAIGDPGCAKLADFGTSKCLTETGSSTLTRAHEFAGTIMYVPREQITDFRSAGPRTDIYSTGVTLYEMLTTRFPFNFPTLFEEAQALAKKERPEDPFLIILDKNPISVREWEPGIHQGLGKIIDKAIQREPQDRFATAEEFGEALEKVLPDL